MRGRPRVHFESWSKVSVVLFERQVQSLDALRAELASEYGVVPLSRAALIRTAVDVLLTTPRTPGRLRTLAQRLRTSSDGHPN